MAHQDLTYQSLSNLPVPPDWPTNIHVIGAWTLPMPQGWTPPDDLAAFLANGEPPVYFGFGSMKVPDPLRMTQQIAAALKATGLRGVLQAGWAGLNHHDNHLITIGDTPHAWLFPRMAAIVHHGGSGTTHAALKAGKPSLVVPFAVDQPFWGQRIAAAGAGVPPISPKRLTVEHLAAALRTLTQDSTMRQHAAAISEQMRAEDAIATALEIIEYASIARGL
jgi:sterol 3beta-glucosyltransferase